MNGFNRRDGWCRRSCSIRDRAGPPQGTGDYNGDGLSDILWQGDDGTPAIWFMNGMNFLGGAAAGSFDPGHDWHVIA